MVKTHALSRAPKRFSTQQVFSLHFLAIALLLVGCLQAGTIAAEKVSPMRFVHPGLLHSQEDLDRVRERVAAHDEPWFSAFAVLAADEHSSANWRLAGPEDHVSRDRNPRLSKKNDVMIRDARAAFQNSIMWVVTGDAKHAEKAVEILNAWGRTLESMGGRDVQLAAGLNGFLLVNAAEIIRWTYPQWQSADIESFEAMLHRAIYPPIKEFATFANGNWDAACIKTTLAIGVFCDDRVIFDRGVDYFYHGAGNGRITHYVINTSGQCQESGRDQQHTQLGLGCLAEACEIGWHQGVDLYGAADNRLLRGYEYTAQFLLGEEVPFEEHTDTTGKYHHTKIATDGHYRARPVFEIALGHYSGRKGLEAPFINQIADRNRPEKRPHLSDHPGYGTLLFYRAKPIASAKTAHEEKD